MITISESAIIQIKKMKKENGESDNAVLRFGVAGGGCSGLNYILHFTEESSDEDVSVAIAKKDLPIVKNTEIDFKENLMGGGFIINNPNAIATCGCGTSFRTKTVSGTPEDC